MDNNDSIKPQQTGGLKLMTVFIAVLALHVLVIGGFTVYHLMSSGTSDADLAFDKTHTLKADGTLVGTANADSTATDKTSDGAPPATTGMTETASANPTTTPAPEPTPAPAPTASATVSPAPAPAPAPLVIASQDSAQVSSTAPGLAPPPDPVPGAKVLPPAPVTSKVAPEISEAAAPSPASVPELSPETSGPIMADNTVASGPVHMPPVSPQPPSATASTSNGEHGTSALHEARREYYTVKITDSYRKIAHAHHITVAQLKEANHIKDSVLHAGQKLIIPIPKTALVKTDDSPDIGTPSRVVLNDSSSTASLSASPTPSATEHHHRYYTVEKGDTLRKIAKKFDVSTSAIKEANQLTESKLTVGKKLKIPSRESRSAVAPVPSTVQPSQVETQPTPIAPMAQPAPMESPAPQPSPATSPELANLTF
jgi:LysM repeat protein